ncbi:MAG: response regulator, partial [Rubrivivax sp.]|nr:response regulator [Rubrivivax sp.]
VLNEQWAGMLGWSLGEYRAAGIYYLDLLHPDDRGVHDAAHAALVAGDTSALACEFRMRHRDGHWVWVQSRGKIVARDDEGRPRRLAGIHLDVTAQKDQERQLARQRQRLDNIIEGTHVGTWEWNVETGETFFNERWAAIVGCTLEGLAPTSILTWTERCHPEDVSRSAVALERHFNGETPHYECEARMRHADGRWVWVLDRGKLFSRSDDGRPRWMAGTRMDITERKRAEAEARAAAELLRGAIDTVNEAFVLYGPDDRLVLCNEKYRNLYALSADLIVPGARFEDIVRGGALRGQYPEAEGRVDEWVAERIALHLAGDVDLVQRIDGGRWLRIVERRMPDGHIVGFRIDVTEIMRAKQEAEDASRAKSQFLANMSHEIRTPMNAILGMLALLQKTDLDARQRDYAGKTEGAARSLLGLLNDILDFSKVEAGKMTLDPQPFRLDRLLGDLAVILAASVGAKPLEVLFDIDPAVPHALVGDAMRLQQVLINLAGNAIKFTPSGEVVVGVRQLASAPGRARLAFWVRDTGIGIAPEHQQRIFSGFTQAEASTTRRFGGTGLGLAICQRLVGMMGGALALDSAPGQGSRFHFEIELPVDDAAAPVVPGSALRVLVVDDNPTARDVLATMCAALGWQADTATGGEDALSRLESVAAGGRRYDAVFVDWQMPGLDGWQTSERIRALAGGDLPLIVMVTAHGREMLSRRDPAQQMLLNGFLVKPVTASMLQAAVEAARPGTAGGTPTGGATVSASRRLQGMRLLVVEDNPNNQQVARELLEDEGAVVRLAGDGREGVQAIAASPDGFDAVLMDLQMPVMDGLAATACIRGELGLAALPIIAMTANAMASDREACLAAGMNDHVGKPFDLDHLVAVLRRHAGRGPSGDAPARAPAALDADCVAAARDAGIDLAAAVARLGGNVAAYARMARSFARDASALAAEIEAGRRAGDREQVARAAHTLKGLAGTLGAGALSADAARHERALKAADGPWPEGREVLAELERVAAALDALAARLQPAAADTPAGIDRAQLAALLDELGALLRDSDMRALDVHAALVERFGAALGERLQPLDASIGMLDFAAALPHVDALQAALAGEGA